MITYFIAGAGGIGQAAALLIAANEEGNAKIILGDINLKALESAMNFVDFDGNTTPVDRILMPKEGENEELLTALKASDVVLDCLPGAQAPRMAKLALENHCHYANLTEYVAETNEIMTLAEGASTAFTLQTGLAPGFINVLACKLYQDFTQKYGVEPGDEIIMKVGALSDNASSPHFYAFTWSPIGVATEYVKDAVVVQDYNTTKVPSLSGTDTILIDGQRYEDNFTSGGAADLPTAFKGKVKDIHYKTLRHPGHYAWVRGILNEIPDETSKISILESKMLSQIPFVEDDNVVIYAAVKGKDSSGRLRKVEKSYKIKPIVLKGRKLRAIQTTTAAPLVQMGTMMVKENLNGVILQSQVPIDKFFSGKYVKMIYG